MAVNNRLPRSIHAIGIQAFGEQGGFKARRWALGIQDLDEADLRKLRRVMEQDYIDRLGRLIKKADYEIKALNKRTL